MRSIVGFIACAALSAASLSAAARLSLSQSVVGPVVFAAGSNGATQTVTATNLGDSSLNLSVSSSVSWLVATVGTPASCPASTASAGCTPIQIALQTSGLTAGMYTGMITVSDPNAVDSPQTITVTVEPGGAIPSSLQFYVAPGGSASQDFISASQATVSATTATGGSWLSVAQDAEGSFQFNVPYKVTATAASTMAVGPYNGSITVSGSSFAGDNKTIPVTLNVTSGAIAQTPNPVTLRVVQNSAAQTFTVPITNTGAGTLTVSSVASATTSGGTTWLAAQAATSGSEVTLTVDPTGLAAGSYAGTVTVNSNAANSTVSIPVQLTVVAQGAPYAYFQGAVNAANGDASVSAGDIASLYGEQFLTGSAEEAGTLPLPTSLDNVTVLVNGTAAPLYYVSARQINFQVPNEVTTGTATVQVQYNGQNGNTISLPIVANAPRLLQVLGGQYGAIENQDYSLPIPTTTGVKTAPAYTGDVITIYAIGLGVTNPVVATGTAAPTSPLAHLTSTPRVCFGNSSPFSPATCVNPSYAGLSPNFVGLFQVNAAVPSGAPRGSTVPLYLQFPDGTTSNTVELVIQ